MKSNNLEILCLFIYSFAFASWFLEGIERRNEKKKKKKEKSKDKERKRIINDFQALLSHVPHQLYSNHSCYSLRELQV